MDNREFTFGTLFGGPSYVWGRGSCTIVERGGKNEP